MITNWPKNVLIICGKNKIYTSTHTHTRTYIPANILTHTQSNIFKPKFTIEIVLSNNKQIANRIRRRRRGIEKRQ